VSNGGQPKAMALRVFARQLSAWPRHGAARLNSARFHATLMPLPTLQLADMAMPAMDSERIVALLDAAEDRARAECKRAKVFRESEEMPAWERRSRERLRQLLASSSPSPRGQTPADPMVAGPRAALGQVLVAPTAAALPSTPAHTPIVDETQAAPDQSSASQAASSFTAEGGLTQQERRSRERLRQLLAASPLELPSSPPEAELSVVHQAQARVRSRSERGSSTNFVRDPAKTEATASDVMPLWEREKSERLKLALQASEREAQLDETEPSTRPLAAGIEGPQCSEAAIENPERSEAEFPQGARLQ